MTLNITSHFLNNYIKYFKIIFFNEKFNVFVVFKNNKLHVEHENNQMRRFCNDNKNKYNN